MKCNKCRFDNAENTVYCQECGTKIIKEGN
jgi:ribosomal protein S27E